MGLKIIRSKTDVSKSKANALSAIEQRYNTTHRKSDTSETFLDKIMTIKEQIPSPDMATETAKFIENEIKEKKGISITTQANLSSKISLCLLD